jgi:hypothetical protein
LLAWLENGGKVGKRGAPDIPGAEDCPSLAAQFQTDFCQFFFNGAGGMKLCVQNMAPVAEVIPSMLR